MEPALPWLRLESAFECVKQDSASAGRVHVAVGDRTQWVALQVEAPGPGSVVVRLESAIMGDARALEALVLAMRLPAGLADELESGETTGDEAPESFTEAVLLGRTLLELFEHNDRLRGVHLHLSDGRLMAVSDLVCLGGSIDPDLLVRRVERLARVADGMELRTTGLDVE